MSRALWISPLLALLVFGACRDATQVRVRVESTLNCPGDGAPELGEATVLVGPKGGVEGPIQTLVAACEEKGAPNYLGDIVVFPREEKDGTAEVWVVASTAAGGETAESCLQGYEGFLSTRDAAAFPATCIIAKRRIAFVPHEELRLTIEVDVDCAGKACEPDTTCYDKGQCRPSDVDCTGTDCGFDGGTTSTSTSGGGDGGAASTTTTTTIDGASSVVTHVSAVVSSVSGHVSSVTTTVDASSAVSATVVSSAVASSSSGGVCSGELTCTYASPMECGPACASICVDGYARLPCCAGSECYCGACVDPNVCASHCGGSQNVASCNAAGCVCSSLNPVVNCDSVID